MTRRILLTAAVAAIAVTVTLRAGAGDHRLRRRPRHRRRRPHASRTPPSSSRAIASRRSGPAATVKVPAGATRVSLAGKTVMPAIVDAHVHTSTTPAGADRRPAARAQFGVGAALSMGLDGTEAPFAQRAQTTPGLARLFLAGRGITAPEKGRTEVPYWITTEAEARKAVQDEAAKKVDLDQDLGRRPRRQVPEADAGRSTARSSTRRTSTSSASRRTSSRSRTPRAC